MSNDRYAVSRGPNYGQGGSISYTGTAGNSGNIPQGLTGVLVTCSTDAWARLAVVASGVAPTAITSDFFCPAGQMVWIPVKGDTGEPWQLSVVRDSASGTARFTPCQ